MQTLKLNHFSIYKIRTDPERAGKYAKKKGCVSSTIGKNKTRERKVFFSEGRENWSNSSARLEIRKKTYTYANVATPIVELQCGTCVPKCSVRNLCATEETRLSANKNRGCGELLWKFSYIAASATTRSHGADGIPQAT